MEITIAIIAAVIIILLAVEYRIKKPGQIILYESNGLVKYRKSNFYPKHFSLVIPNTTYTLTSSVEPEAKGKIGLMVKYSASVTPSLKNISKLIRIGGWGKDVLNDAAKELDVILQGIVKEYTEKFDIEEIKSEGIANYLREKVKETEVQLGLEIISLTIQSVEPADRKIAEAIRQKEASRILEETEKNNQKTRIQTAQMKLKADEEIIKYEHELALKKIQLKEVEEDKEASVALKKLNEQVKRDKIKLEIEKVYALTDLLDHLYSSLADMSTEETGGTSSVIRSFVDLCSRHSLKWYPSSKTEKNTSTTPGSKCLPLCWRMCSSTCSLGQAGR